jgi:AcrR family transcriptional regulator
VEETRKKLLKAAIHEFSDVGLSRASVESIAERAQLSPSVVRALYVDKDRLFKAVMEEQTNPLLSAIALAVERIEDPKELIRKSLHLFDEWLLDNPEYVRVMQWSMLEKVESIDEFYENSFFPSDFYERLERLSEEGKIRGRNVLTTMLLLDSLILFSHMIRPSLSLMSSDEDDGRFFEMRLEAIMDLLERGLFNP